MTEKEPKYTVGDTADECDPVLTDHTGMGFPAPQPIILPGGFDAIHAIVSGLMADKQELQAELRQARDRRDELLTAVVRLARERDAARQERDGWAAQEAVRTGGQRQSSAQRFIATLQAWRRQVPYAQQAAILAGLIAEEEGEK